VHEFNTEADVLANRAFEGGSGGTEQLLQASLMQLGMGLPALPKKQ
jgi:hypothetical protein